MMPRRFWVMTLVLAAAACARKESDEFNLASKRFNKLYAQQLDDAYVDPGMREVESLLQRVPSDSLDAPAAKQLLKRIQDGRASADQATRERALAMAQARLPPKISGSVITAPTPPVPTAPFRPPGPPDAGPPPVPNAGMSMRDFNLRFGDCFESAGPVEVTGRGTRDSFGLADTARCRAALPTMVNAVVLADGQTVLGVVPKSALTRTPVDGGTPAPPDAGG
jgi:hypothetical protein